MKIEGWEPRALPCAERCERWAEQGGRFFVILMQMVIDADHDMVLRRSVRLIEVVAWEDGNPVPWSTFDEATDAPCREGWEWAPRRDVHTSEVAYKDPREHQNLDTGDLIQPGETIPAGVRVRAVRRVVPTAEVPSEWEALGDWIVMNTHQPRNIAHPDRDGWQLEGGSVYTSLAEFGGKVPEGMWFRELKRKAPTFDVPEDWEADGDAEYVENGHRHWRDGSKAWLTPRSEFVFRTSCIKGWALPIKRTQPEREGAWWVLANDHPATAPRAGHIYGGDIALTSGARVQCVDVFSWLAPIPSPKVCAAIHEAEKAGVDVADVLHRVVAAANSGVPQESLVVGVARPPIETARQELERVSGVRWGASSLRQASWQSGRFGAGIYVHADCSEWNCSLSGAVVTSKPVRSKDDAIEAASRFILDNYRAEVSR